MAQNESDMSRTRRHVLSCITVEPAMFLGMFASYLQGVSEVTLSLYKICTVTLGHSSDICSNDTLNETLKDEIQIIEADLALYRTYLQTIPAFVMALIWGSWSDLHNRKMPMIVAKCGYFLSSLWYLIASFFTHWPPEVLFASSLVVAITGGYIAFSSAIFSYVADKNKESNLTLRFGLVEAANFSGAVLGNLTGGYLQKYIGFHAIFGLASLLRFLVIVYLFYRVDNENHQCDSDGETENETRSRHGLCHLGHFTDAWKTCTRHRDGHKRLWLWLSLLTCFVLTIPLEGESTVSYLFYNKKFNWDRFQYSVYGSVGTAYAVVGLLIVLVSTRFLKLKDPVLQLISDLPRTINPFIIAFADQQWIPWAAQVLTLLYALSPPAMKSFMLKLVSSNEIGKVYSLKGVIESLVSFFGVALYTRVYKMTIQTFPGAFLLLSAGFSFIAVIFYVFIIFDIQRSDESLLSTNTEREQPEESRNSVNT